MEIQESQKRTIQELSQQFGIRLLVIFGSQATQQARPRSDVDIAYLSHNPLTLKDESIFAVALGEILKNQTIDITTIAGAPPLLLYSIFKDGFLVYEVEPGLFDNYVVYAFKRYVETRPLFRQRLERLQNST